MSPAIQGARFSFGGQMTTAEQYLEDMSLEEKAALLTGETVWTTTAIPRLGLPSLRMSDGPHGVRRTHATGSMAFGAHDGDLLPDRLVHVRHVGSRPRARDGPGDRPGGHRLGGRCRAGSRREHEAQPAVRPELRVLLRGPASRRASWGPPGSRASSRSASVPRSSTSRSTTRRPGGCR